MYTISFAILDNRLIVDKKITAENVRYDWFIGDVKMQTNDGCIDISWGWIPVVDFAIAFKIISGSLATQNFGCEQFDFTDTGEVIDVSRKMNLVEICPSWREDTLMVTFDEFRNEIDRFYDSVIEEVFHANPCLRKDKEFLRIIKVD